MRYEIKILSDRPALLKTLLFWGVFFTSLAVFLLTITQNFSFDALTNGLACETGDPNRWFHPNHPFYPFLGYLWYRVERLFGYASWSIYSLARFNALLNALGLGILFLSLCRYLKKSHALISVFFFGSLFCVWHNAVDGIAMGAETFFLIAVAAYLARLDELDEIPPRAVVLLGLLSGVTVLMHGIAVFHALAVGLFFLRGRRRWTYWGCSGALVAVVYLSVYFFIVWPQQKRDFLSWAVGYASHEGLAQAHRSGFWATGLENYLRGLWHGWIDAIMASGPVGSFSFFLAHFAALYALGLTVWAAIRLRKPPRKGRRLLPMFLAWGGLATVFCGFWAPGASHFRMHIFVPWTVAWALASGDRRPLFRIHAVLATLLFSFNFSTTLYPEADIRNNKSFQALSEIQARLAPGDFFLCSHGTIRNVAGLRPYFFPNINGGPIEGRLLEFHERSLSPLADSLKRHLANGKNIYFSGDLMDLSVQQPIEQAYRLTPGELENFMKGFLLTPAFRLENGLEVYKAGGH